MRDVVWKKLMKMQQRVTVFLAACLLTASSGTAEQTASRVERGLIAFYDFGEESGNKIHDRSGFGKPLDLVIEESKSARWLKGTLRVESSASIGSVQPAKKLVDAVKKSSAVTVEAWIKPASQSQSGPARIVSLSSNPSQRNITLGQEKDSYDVRLRTADTNKNGIPSTSSPKRSLQSRLTHVVFTRDAGGWALIYVDGKQVARKKIGGKLENWDSQYRLILANETTRDRPWLGELHLVAIYDRALSADEVARNYAAGSRAGVLSAEELAAARIAEERLQMFDTKIAPLFTRHCLECHDSAIKKGGLDLSRKTAALAGGESGQVITPGKSTESLLWDYVESNEMPRERAALSATEKAALKKWLDAGAVWTSEAIDPVLYLHAEKSNEVWIQRLTVSEYIETVRSAVGVDIAKEARELLPPDLRADGFSNTAYNLNVDFKHVEAYGKLARIIVDRMDVLKFAARFSKSRSLSTDDTMRDQVAAMGKWLLRGPLDKREIDLYSGIATTVSSAGGDFEDAMSFIIEAMLQSPRFVYRVEDQRGNGAERRVRQYELASRLSYILWGGPPDTELMRAADDGELSDRKKLKSQVQRMLKDPRAIDRSAEFISDWLDLDRLANLQPNADKFPTWNAQLAADMREETLKFFKEVTWTQNRPLVELLNAQVTFATPRLAKHYGLEPKGEGVAQYELSSNPTRGGLLTHGSVLTIGGDDASMVSRGLFVLHDLLRGTINAPPPCVNTTPPPTKEGLTQRGIAEVRIADQKCGVCHSRFEPLAFGLEKFDGIGAFHEQDEHGNDLRDDGEILFPGESEPVEYKSSAELMDLLAGSERVRESLTWKVTQFAVGRPLVAADAAEVARIHQSAQQAGGTYANLLEAIVLSDLVQKTRTEHDK